MNKMSKDKRDKLILVVLAVLGVLGVLYTFVLGAQKEALSNTQIKITSVQDKVSKAERLLRAGPTIEETLAQSQMEVNQREEEMAPPGQYFYWFLKLMDGFRQKEALQSITIVDITHLIYKDMSAALQRVAEFSVQAHLEKLVGEGRVKQENGRYLLLGDH